MANNDLQEFYAKLFEATRLGRLELPNRIVMAPMTRYFSPGGTPGADVAAYYRRRAEGGAGLIITEGSWIPHPGASNDDNAPRMYGSEALEGWARVVQEVHAAGGRIMPQLWHVGLTIKPAVNTLGLYENNQLEERQVGPSGMASRMNEPQIKLASPMTSREIDDVIAAYAEAAAAAFKLGFDGVELHAAHGYLIDQFFWHETNLRDDIYGGDHGARAKFGAEVVKACKSATIPDFPVVLRMSQWKLSDFNAKLAKTADELSGLLTPLVDAGVDAFHCSQRRFWTPEFEGSDLNLAGWVKKLTGKATITVGSVGLNVDFFESLEGAHGEAMALDRLMEMLDRNDFDFVAVGRALIGDPAWPIKVKAGDLDTIQQFTPDNLSCLS